MLDIFKAINENDILETLLLIPGYYDDVNKEGYTPFMTICQKNMHIVLKYALQKIPKKHILDTNIATGRNAMHVAALSGSYECLSILLDSDHAFDINAVDESNSTPLHCAASISTECVKLLLDRGADASILNDYSQSALAIALYYEFPGMVELLS